MFRVTCQAAVSRLSHAYAIAVDERDAAGLRAVFWPHAVLTTTLGPAEHRYAGHAALQQVIDAVAQFDLTLHDVGAQRIELAGARGRGEVACVAHHLRRRDATSADDDVLHLRYDDDYRRDDRGEWRIAARRLTLVASERRRVGIGAA